MAVSDYKNLILRNDVKHLQKCEFEHDVLNRIQEKILNNTKMD